MNEKRLDVLENTPVTQAILKMSLPVVFGMIVQVLYNLVDTYFIGKIGDANQLAAANISMPVFIILMALAGIVGTGAASYISRCLGAKNDDQANKTLSTGVFLCIALGLMLMVVGLLFLPQIARILGSSDNVFPYTYSYVRSLFIGSVFIMLNFALGQLLRSEGAAMLSIVGMLIGTVVNIILDPILISTLQMGVEGAAIATVLGNLSGVIFYLFLYITNKTHVKLRFKSISFDGVIWSEIFKIGIPSAINQGLMSVALIVYNNLVASYGDAAIAGLGVSTKLLYMGTFVLMGFAAGCQPLVGYNFGANNSERVTDIIKKGLIITFLIGVAFVAVFALFGHDLVAAFTPLDNVVEWGTRVLRIQMLMFFVVGPQMIVVTSIQALGRAKESIILSVARQGFIFIPLLNILNWAFGFTGLIAAQPTADVLTFTLASTMLKRILTKSKLESNAELTEVAETQECVQI